MGYDRFCVLSEPYDLFERRVETDERADLAYW